MKNKFLISLTLAAVVPCLEVSGAPAATTSYQFAENSLLANGKWVRIEVPETGLYEITYDQLRAMGFADPSKVSVFGQGGAMLSSNFLDARGNIIFKDNPSQIRVLHSDDKLIFYGFGPENMTASTIGAGDDEKIKFTRSARNIYTDVSSYLLSDAYPVEPVPSRTVSDKANAAEQASGFSYIYHEKDLKQAGSGTGQVFWGEKISNSEPVSFEVSQPYSIEKPAYVNATVAVDISTSGSLFIHFNNSLRSFPISSIAPVLKALGYGSTDMKFNIDGSGLGKGTVKFSVDSRYGDEKILAVDWWTVSCPISLTLASEADFSQQYIAFTPIADSSNWKHSVPAGSVAWDITKRQQPIALEVTDGYMYNQTTSLSEIIVFNPSHKQKQIGDNWHPVANQNLHAWQNEGAELLIFSTEDMLPYARRIAELHEQYDGIKVIVTTPTELYNEFSAGAPDPMAYRAMAKMLFHNNNRKLKNVLFIGKMSADIRNVRQAPGFAESHIAYQQVQSNLDSSASCVMDYFGCLTDYLTYPDNLTNVPISVGVGNLPISTAEEGSNVVAKIKEFLEKKDFSNLVNETMTMACEGDNYLHDAQSAEFTNMMQSIMSSNFDSEFSHHQIRVDALGEQGSRQQNLDAFERGKLFSLYFGHANSYGFGKSSTNFNSNDLMSMKNKELGFYFMAACDLCAPDQSLQGFGDVGVTRAKRAFIGTVCSTRSVMSNDNENLARSFFKAFFFDRNNVLRTSTPTIGEVYSQAKNAEGSASQLAFQLIGDPALKLPMPLGKVSLEVDGKYPNPGDIITVKGKILDSNSRPITSYNGYVTVKLMAPSKKIVLPVYIKDTNINISSDMTDFRLTAVKGEVKDGTFTISVPVPEACTEYMSTSGAPQAIKVMAGTYDPTTRLACSGNASVTMAVEGSEPDPDAVRDTDAPVVTLAYDPFMQTIAVEASDDVALRPGIGNGAAIALDINGKYYTVANDESDDVAMTSFATTVSTARLKPGKYTAGAVATDLSGNRSQPVKIEFEVSDAAPLALKADAEFAIDEITFSLDKMTGEQLTLVMTDSDGRIVLSSETDSDKVLCDVSSLEPGIYRAALRHNSPKGARLYSNWVEFTVID